MTYPRTTDQDGRCEALLDPDHKLKTGLYKLTFQTGHYFVATERDSFYPVIDVRIHRDHLEEPVDRHLLAI